MRAADNNNKDDDDVFGDENVDNNNNNNKHGISPEFILQSYDWFYVSPWRGEGRAKETAAEIYALADQDACSPDCPPSLSQSLAFLWSYAINLSKISNFLPLLQLNHLLVHP